MAGISRTVADPDLGVNGFIGLEYLDDADYRWVVKMDYASRAAKAAATRALKQFSRRIVVSLFASEGLKWLKRTK